MKFVTAINCMDGRTQLPIIEWLRKELGADYVDMITEPGPNKILAENRDKIYVDSIKRRVEISVKKHHSNVIAIIGHHDCAGNPGAKEMQLSDIITAVNNVKLWGYDVRVLGLWVDENWQVHKVK